MLQKNMSDAEFARQCELKYTTYKGILSGRVPSFENAFKIANANSVSLDWLAGEDGFTASAAPSVQSNSDVTDYLFSIPRFDVEASAGNGMLVQSENVEDHFTVSKEWFAKIAPRDGNVGIIEARGDSMEPTIQDGDIMMVNFNINQKHVAVGGVFVISVGGNLLVKRLQIMTNGDIKIVSDNDLYETEIISAEMLDESVVVHGQVIWTGGKIRRR